MKELSRLCSLVLALVLAMPVMAQEDLAPCGTDLGISPWLRDFQRRIDETPRTDELLYLPIQVHVVGTDEGAGYFSNKGIMDAFCTLNADFVDANIQFFMPNPINFIDNSTFYDHTFQQGAAMMIQNNLPNIINCYIVQSPAGNCGYFSPSRDGIALSKGCLAPNDHTWAHEVGHFLSLPHPFFGWEGHDHDYDEPAPNNWGGSLVERLDGSNCNIAADGFCDTAPDYLSFRWSCTSNSTSSIQQTDPNGETFVSDGTLIMSYSNDQCVVGFSDDQIAAMRANVEEERPNLISVPPVLEDVAIEAVDQLTVTNPEPGTLVETETITLEWEPVPNVTHYVLQINPFNIFSIVFEEQIVEGSSAVITDLREDETYYWRVRPFNAYETCTAFTSPSSFTTGTIVSTNELLAGELLELFPNPTNGDQLHMNLKLNDQQQGQCRIVDATGAVLRSQQLSVTNSLQRIELAVQGLPAGMYFVQLVLEDRQVMRKVVIH